MSENKAPARKITKLVVKGTILPADIKLGGNDKRGVELAQVRLTSISNFKAGSKTERTLMVFGGKNGGNLKNVKPLLEEIVASGEPRQVEFYVEAREGFGSLTFISQHTPQQRSAAA